MCGGYQYVERSQEKKSNNYLMSDIYHTDRYRQKGKDRNEKKLSAH